MDTHYRDPLANLALTTSGQLALFEALSGLAPRWLAFGGGGYDMGVVPRAWALAFGAMSGQAFPDELPEAYQARYGGRWLRDREGPPLGEADKIRIRHAVERVVAAVKQRHRIE